MPLLNSPLFPYPLSTFLRFPSQGPFLNIWLNPKDLCLHRTLIHCRHYVEEESTKGPSRDVIARKKWAWRPVQNLVTQSAVHGPAAVASSGSLVEKQELRPTSDLLSQSLHWNRMTCVHVTVCADFEERRVVLSTTRMAKSRWLKRWSKINWLFCQGFFCSNILVIDSQSWSGIWLIIYKYTFPDQTLEIQIPPIWRGTQESPSSASTSLTLLALVGICIP